MKNSIDQSLFDPLSPTWIYVLSVLEKELETARTQNDSLSNDELRTASLRGQIKLLKKLVNLPTLSRKEIMKETLRLAQKAHR